MGVRTLWRRLGLRQLCAEAAMHSACGLAGVSPDYARRALAQRPGGEFADNPE
ncbi:methionine synthase [Streptomyces violaceorubidus]